MQEAKAGSQSLPFLSADICLSSLQHGADVSAALGRGAQVHPGSSTGAV